MVPVAAGEGQGGAVRAVVSRVDGARVEVGGAVVGEITGAGLLVLVGVTHTDDEDTARRLAAKVAGLRVLHGEESVVEAAGAVLVVSQFTLYGDTRKGRRPSWSAAAPGPAAAPLVAVVADALRTAGLIVATGVFGADMRVTSVNDGPFTVLVEV